MGLKEPTVDLKFISYYYCHELLTQNMVALSFFTFLLSPRDEVVKHASPGIFNTLYFCTFAFKKKCIEVPARLDTCNELVNFRALAPEC